MACRPPAIATGRPRSRALRIAVLIPSSESTDSDVAHPHLVELRVDVVHYEACQDLDDARMSGRLGEQRFALADVARRADGAVEGESLLELGVGLFAPICTGEQLGGAQPRVGLVEQ